MSKEVKIKPLIIVDSREHKPYTFRESSHFAGCKTEKLDSGDYSIEGLEDKNFIYIDRKASFGELAQNLFSKSDKERFHDCLERTHLYKYKFIIIEENLSDIRFSIALKKMRLKPEALLKRIVEISMEYGISFFFCGKTGGHEVCLSILKRSWERWLKRE